LTKITCNCSIVGIIRIVIVIKLVVQMPDNRKAVNQNMV